MLGTGNYLVLPGESDLTLVRQMVTRFDADATQAGLSVASAAKLGLTPYQVIISASIVEKEGYYPVNMPKTARVIYNRLANGMPLQMDSTVLVRPRPGRRAGDSPGPEDPVALQHLPQHRAAADPHLHAVADRTEGGGRSARRRPGSTSSSSRRTGSWPSPTPTPSSWPTSSWPSHVDFPEPLLTMEEARARCGPDATVVGVIGSPIAHSLSPALAQRLPSPPWG